jgi:hypothetical protein
MWRKKEASTNIIIIDVSNHTPKQKQILIGEPEEEVQFFSLFKIIVLGAIVPLTIIGIFTYFCYHCFVTN